MKTAPTLRPLISGMTVPAGFALAFAALPADEAEAQASPPATRSENSPISLDTIDVAGDASPNTLQSGTGLDRLPGTVQSTPQTITVIPQVTIQQQQATTIDQVLRYVPGITVATGEGNGGMNGDAFRIRGFDAKGDIYVDGLRDFGAYVRDSFATESVQVLKGSSSESFGNGTTGGVINQTQKKAHLGDSYGLETTLGTGPQKRVVADVNKQIGDHSAMRIVGMWHDQDIVDRDHVYSKRWGVLGSLGFGLGTDQTLTINYLHQEGDRRPDMGVPIIMLPPGVRGYGLPVTEYGVPKSNYFGKETDRDETRVDMLTVRFRKEFDNGVTISNDTRYANYSRRMAFTPTICGTGFGGFANFGTCSADVLRGNLNTTYTVWPVVGDRQDSDGAQNVTTALARFRTGSLRHELIGGLDLYYQNNTFGSLAGSVPRTGGTLLNPNFNNPPGFYIYDTNSGLTRASAWNVGVFASDRIWFTDQISILAGLRWDDYNAKSSTYAAALNGYGPWSYGETKFLSPKASLIWEPTPSQTYYATYARSFTPQGQNISFQGAVSPSQPGLSPDKNTTYEIGAKWSVLNNQLGLTAALFRTIKDRGTYEDPLTGASVLSGEKDQVQGLELGATGKVTSAWTVQAAYTYLDSKILAGGPIGNFNPTDSTGNPVAYVSKHNFALWSTYDIASLVHVPGKLLVGGGVNYRSEYNADPNMLYRIPGVTTLDALISWEDDRYRVALNITNLTDQLAYTSAFYYRAEVAPGRTFTLSASAKF